jgi:hypothetical protein
VAREQGSITGSPLTADPLLGPLADNGGPTQTMALGAGSPAIDAGSAFGLATDQRGQPRPFVFAALAHPGDGSDIGAFELQGPTITITSPAANSTYTQGQAVTAAYSCTAPAGATVTACTGPVANGAPIDTHALGQHRFTVNAQDSDGLTNTQSASYTVLAPPTITITTPAANATYTQGQALTAAYSCTAPAGATVTACAGPVANGAPIDTQALGSHTFTVNAQDSDGGTATKSAGYTVVAAVMPAPIVSGAGETAKTWRENDALPHITVVKKKRPPIGTAFSFTLNERATVTLSFTQRSGGRKVHGKCVAQTKKNRRKPRCTRR